MLKTDRQLIQISIDSAQKEKLNDIQALKKFDLAEAGTNRGSFPCFDPCQVTSSLHPSGSLPLGFFYDELPKNKQFIRINAYENEKYSDRLN